MFQTLQKKLTFLYTLTTGTILTVILIICFFYMKRSPVQGAVFQYFPDDFQSFSDRSLFYRFLALPNGTG